MLPVSGFVPLSTVDYPGKIAAVVFTQGCPWRCVYCHNPHLRAFPDKEGVGQWKELLISLEKRKKLLDAVVFSGGEPLIHPTLSLAIEEVKALGYQVGLHTTGMVPRRLRKILPLLDWVGLDIKAPFEEYATITGFPRSGSLARESAELLLASGVPYECRTTIHPHFFTVDTLLRLSHTLAEMGVTHYWLQRARLGPAKQTEQSRLYDQENYRPLFPLFHQFGIR